MSTFEILAAILGSSVLSTILSAWFNLKMQNRNYKKDYYKKILDKRISSYERVNELNSLLATFVQMEGYIVHAHFMAEQPLNFFCNQVRDCINESLWLSSETGAILTGLNTFIINEFDNKIDPSWTLKKRNTVIRDIAKDKYEEINEFKVRLKNLVSNDIKNLYKIDRFFNEVDEGEQFPLHNRNHSHESDKDHYE